MKQILLKHIVGFIYHHLTFDINWLVAIGIKRPLGLMFQGVVVFMPARCDGWLCVMNVLCLTKTYKEQISINTIVCFFHWIKNSITRAVSLHTVATAIPCTTHGVPYAALPAPAAGQTDTTGIVAEFLPSTVFIFRANSWLLQHDEGNKVNHI